MTNAGFSVKQYGMTRPHLIAKLILAAMGVYLLMRFMDYIRSFSLWYRTIVLQDARIPPLLIIAITGVIALVASLILLFWSDWFVRLMTGTDTAGCEKVDEYLITAAFRTIACFCGLLILYTPVSLFIVNIPAIITDPDILSYLTVEGQSSLFSAKSLTSFFVELTKGIFGLYLIFGAPHYARWQTKLAVKQQNQTGGVKL